MSPDPVLGCLFRQRLVIVLSRLTIPVGFSDPNGGRNQGSLVGIDESLESCAVCVVIQSGTVAREAKAACEP